MPGKILKRTMKGTFLTRYQNTFQNVKQTNKPVLKQYNVVIERDKPLIEEIEKPSKRRSKKIK